MMPKNTTRTGQIGEDFVCTQLMQRGYRILDRNVREKFAEIDIIAQQEQTICFVEVRTRTNAEWGHPAETITPRKQRLIRRAAESWLVKRRLYHMPSRFDVATILWDNMAFEYWENAFGQDY
ncbi:MAG: YraN family protein [Proteobacteria bacterium]|jgi:putative endonuclease|nr:YraN family protein [Pseudomonadota bacterium]NLN63546.1 YraN family protein [Myxococcales bacterium]